MRSDDHHFLVQRGDPTRCDVRTLPLDPLQPGEARVAIERFGLTANNVTYAALGESLHYFEFFPAPALLRAEGWARVPAWGIGTVLESRSPEVAVGAKVYGFFPMSTHATLQPARGAPTGFRVDRPHIPPEFGVYSAYNVQSIDPFHIEGRDDHTVVFRPLFLTGLLLADYLAVHDFMQAEAVLISSASSKTAYGVAAALRAGPRRRVLGVSSAANAAFAASLGVYDEVLCYEDLPALPRERSLVYVDIAGSAGARAAVLDRLGAGVKLNLAVGMSHGQPGGYRASTSHPEVRSELFFAPGWMAQRHKEAGQAFVGSLLAGWRAQMADVGEHFQVVRGAGPEALVRTYLEIARGQSRPETAHVLTLADV